MMWGSKYLHKMKKKQYFSLKTKANEIFSELLVFNFQVSKTVKKQGKNFMMLMFLNI